MFPVTPDGESIVRITDLRRKLPPGTTYYSTWIGPIAGNRPRTTHRRVVSQSKAIMQSEILSDHPQKGHVMRLEWSGVRAVESLDVITLSDDLAEFVKLDTITAPVVPPEPPEDFDPQNPHDSGEETSQLSEGQPSDAR